MSLHRRVSAFEASSTARPSYRTPEEQAEEDRRFDELWRQLYEEYGIERGETSENPVGEFYGLVEEYRREAARES